MSTLAFCIPFFTLIFLVGWGRREKLFEWTRFGILLGLMAVIYGITLAVGLFTLPEVAIVLAAVTIARSVSWLIMLHLGPNQLLKS